MPQNQSKLNASQPIVEKNGTMTQTMRTQMLIVSNNTSIVNSGSPEGVVEATQYSEYIDETTPLSPVVYKKMLTEIGGDRKKGWAAI